MMDRRVSHRVCIAAALCICLAGVRTFAQEPEPAPANATEQPQEYTEYESVPPPNVDLQTDVVPVVSGESTAQPSDSETGQHAEASPASSPSEPDPIIAEVNRELDLRSGAAAEQTEGESVADKPGSTSFSLIKAFAWLLVVIAMILLLYYFLQRRSSGGKLLTGTRLGTVLGRLYLNPRVCLHFVRTGGKVLVVGQTQNALSLIAEFSEEEFAASREESPEEERQHPTPAPNRDFFSQLRANLTQMSETEEEDAHESQASIEDDDIAALRGDIHRLQEYLRDSSREPDH